MVKRREASSFVCQECGYASPSWLGKCPECGVWNSLKEIKFSSSAAGSGSVAPVTVTPHLLSDVAAIEADRTPTGFSEMDTVLGGGIVKGAAMLLAGDPGIGKSTLLLQLALNLAAGPAASSSQGAPASLAAKRGANADARLGSPSLSSPASTRAVLYVSAEESEEQVKMRASRLSGKNSPKNFFLLSCVNTDAIASLIAQTKPSFVIIDSIQTVESANAGGLAGSVSQVRYAAATFIRLAKEHGIPIIVVGHVTKEGMVAGPMVLSHMVDTVLFLEGEKNTEIRLLRSLKNRFGPVDEVGVFIMGQDGMREVSNPQEIFISAKKDNVPGSVLVVIIEGTRVFLVEVQALVVYAKQAFPRRVASGVDAKRLELLLAVLQKHCRLPVESMDVFVNVAGGLKVVDRALDVGICLAVFSSFKNIALNKIVGAAEVGLLGELRPVPMIKKREREAKKLGFSKVVSAEEFRYLPEVLSMLEKKGVKTA